ncbi:acyl-CoA dehydrogenase, C-terminal domain protein [Asticcacaulis biprosthecium C19]|uniref:3-methylmercaptopropionyl-CoA dehydrogenase n=1 Tax=Asticcacaulis biprosthecium C19 TaxID=715226 RepID=F4QT51_9CAUL|nr:acyl-CoA dehydrogenase [Asticcacaulis biprosthecium]EGF89921.1 acyl-CoA dehydrogenase, C-terminal domain protein [Asticcacaulis biprosthecium C19]
MTYRPAIKDIAFCLDHVVDQPKLYGTAAFPDVDGDLRDAVLEAAAQLAGEVLAPLNRVGDDHGSKLDGDQVTVAPGFLDAIKAYAGGGWYGVAADPAYGGQGMPKTLEQACFDMFNGANMAFTLLPTLSQGAIEAVHAHGTQAQKDLYLPRLISGEWAGTMNLTEPQAGSDLAALAARAEPNGDGTYAIHGQKIFITWGEHGGAENIVHLVLARLPDAPKGTRGISLFLCPKFLVGSDGQPGERNRVKCVGLEHKLGIHASPTCVMAFEGAQGELIGPPHGGLAAMFTMMNAARLAVGFQGVGVAEAAWQQAVTYAKDRKQGRSLITGQDGAAIYDHPDVRLMLAKMKAKTEAARAICFLTAAAIDQGKVAEDEDERLRAKRREDFLVPIAKAWSTDVGVEVASLGVQVHGGMGFIEETGAAQYYRDARIAPIYEGTNGIQAADLVGRKLGSDGMAAMELAGDIVHFLKFGILDFSKEAKVLEEALDAFMAATEHLLAQKTAAPLDVATGATTYLQLAGDVIGGWMLLKGAVAARSAEGDVAWLADRVKLMQVYFANVLPHASAHLAAIKAGFAPLDGLNLAFD